MIHQSQDWQIMVETCNTMKLTILALHQSPSPSWTTNQRVPCTGCTSATTSAELRTAPPRRRSSAASRWAAANLASSGGHGSAGSQRCVESVDGVDMLVGSVGCWSLNKVSMDLKSVANRVDQYDESHVLTNPDTDIEQTCVAGVMWNGWLFHNDLSPIVTTKRDVTVVKKTAALFNSKKHKKRIVK